MAKDLVKVKHKGETVFSSENEMVKDNFLKEIMGYEATFTGTTFPEKNCKDKCVKVTMDELTIVSLLNRTYLLWLQKGTTIYIRN